MCLGEPGSSMSIFTALTQHLLALQTSPNSNLNLSILLTSIAYLGLILGSLRRVLLNLLDRYIRLPVIWPERLPELTVDPELTQPSFMPVPRNMLSQALHGRHPAGANLAYENFGAVKLILSAIIGGESAVFKFALKFENI